MAEFQQVMRQLGRICASNFGECEICDLRPFCPSKTFFDKYVKSGRTERLEEMVLSWAAEHPEPVYPTWREYLKSIKVIVPRKNYTVMDTNSLIVGQINTTPIPADIASKLGIQPKEGNHD